MTESIVVLARKGSLALSKVYGLLDPGPVVRLTASHKGVDNVMTMSWQTMMEFEPPLVGCVVSKGDYSSAALQSTRYSATVSGIHSREIELRFKMLKSMWSKFMGMPSTRSGINGVLRRYL